MTRNYGSRLRRGIRSWSAGAVLMFGQQDESTQSPTVCEGSMLYRSPISGAYELIPLVHTDATLDVRGLVAAATVTQHYENLSSIPIEAVYVFPLPHDAAVYDMEIRIGSRIIRSRIRGREEAKRTYEAAKSAGKRTALVEEDRPNIFTTSVANIMPGDHIDVRLRYVEPLRWEQNRIRLEFPMVVGPRNVPGTQANCHAGTGCAKHTAGSQSGEPLRPRYLRDGGPRSWFRNFLDYVSVAQNQDDPAGGWKATRRTRCWSGHPE